MNVLILSGIASAINYIQSLGNAPDFRLFVSDCDPFCPGLYMPGITPVLLPRARVDLGNYQTALQQALDNHAVDILIPTSDQDVEAVLLLLQGGWKPRVKLFRPPFESFCILGYKDKLAAHLSRTFAEFIPRIFNLETDPYGLPYPVVLKPKNMGGGKGVVICKDPRILLAAREHLAAIYGNQVMIQEFIPGDTYVLTMVYDHQGVPVVSVGMRSHLTSFTWGGGGSAGELVDEPQLVDLAQSLVAEVGGWCGPINLEFRRHKSTRRFYLMEANCRLNGYSYLTTMNGINLPRLAVDILLGQSVVPSTLPAPQNRRNFILGYREKTVENLLCHV